MYDIKPLEEQWERYNKKRRRPLFVLMIFILLFAGVGAFLDYKNFTLSDFHYFDTNKSIKTAAIKPSDVLVDKSLTKLEVSQTVKSDTPLITASNEPVASNIPNNNPMEASDVFVEEESVKKRVPMPPKVVVPQKTRTRKKIHFEMVDADTPAAYREIESRFSVAPDPDDSLFLANMYYDKRKYSKAAYWALQTNRLSGDIEQSWLIFAKSKAKIGKKNEAIRVLSQYVKRSKSEKAKKLLKKLKNN